MADAPHVVLVSPDGHETTASTPTAVNNLVYGAGYTLKSGTVDDAIRKVRPARADPATTAEKPAAQSQSPAEKK